VADKYEEIVGPNLILIERWKRNGLSEREIAEKLGISYSTFRAYKKEKSALSAHLKKGAEIVDTEVENALLKRALGYSFTEITREQRDGELTITKTVVKEIQPDVTAQIFWLKNRATDKWRDKPVESLSASGYEPVNIPAGLIAPIYFDLNRRIDQGEITEAVIKGGRGGLKSSYVGLKIPELLMRNPSSHALVTRNVGNTIRDSVYAQIKWGIEQLGVEDRFECTVSPMQIVYKPTGQIIYFRGMDDPLKIKSIKVPFGYIGILWYEEFDQYAGEEAIRSVNQSALRGTDEKGESKTIKFETFNPPATAQNWANRYVLQPRKGMTVLHTSYLDVPKEWLGQAFIDEAETLKELNPKAYENEYLGEVTGTGGNVFENLEIREITDKEIENFDRVKQGLDWGYYPDPMAFVRLNYDSARRTIYIFDEVKRIKTSNEDAASEVLNAYKETCTIADSAEEKSIAYFHSQGYNMRGAVKGPGSVEYGMKWLSSLVKIVIDRRRCPETAKEFEESEYLKDKDGNYISGYPDKNNHFQDAVRYALNDEIQQTRAALKKVRY
jgi:PBSX family phage terminase large subunit